MSQYGQHETVKRLYINIFSINTLKVQCTIFVQKGLTMQAIHHASPTFSTRFLVPGSWLDKSGLNEGELALASIHRRSAERLVELLFSLKTLPARFRDGMKSLLRNPMDRELYKLLHQ